MTLVATNRIKTFGLSKRSTFNAIAERTNRAGGREVTETTAMVGEVTVGGRGMTASKVKTVSRATTGGAMGRQAMKSQAMMVSKAGMVMVMVNATEGPSGQYATQPGPVREFMVQLLNVTSMLLGGLTDLCGLEPQI